VSAPKPSSGPKRRGRPPCCSRELATLVINMHQRGLTYMQICIALNAKGIPTPMGRPRWIKSSVARLLRTRYVREIIEQTGSG
jgi:hypothetical protein